MQLAQLNVGRLVDDPDSEAVREFVEALERINALGDASPGFVWRLADDDGPGAVEQRFPGHEDDPRFVVNLTVWTDADALREFVYRSDHTAFLRRRREWFEPPVQPTTVLWWVDDGHVPTLEEAAERLDALRRLGPTPRAFDLRTRYPSG